MEFTHPELPAGAASGRPLPWFLAMEEHLARNYSDEFFFTWAVGPTVIFGRHQIIESEVNLPYCRKRGIEFYRRKSGGGCVYADSDNLMLCMVASSADVAATFARYCGDVAESLGAIGIPAEVSGRNDITIGGRKVSGNSFMRIPPSRSIVHGTMLLDSDPATMAAALTPSREKLAAKGVASVRSRVTTLREHLPGLTRETLDRHLVERFCGDRRLTLTSDDVAEIDRLAAPYFDPEWIYGHTARHTSRDLVARRRVEGVGEFLATITLADTAGNPTGAHTENATSAPVIRRANLQGDFFLTGDLDTILNALNGIPLTRAALTAALAPLDIPAIITGLTPTILTDLLLSATPAHDNHCSKRL